ncbi:transcription factor HBP-1b(c38)-like isoform X1 [Papaver somniferum]|uniref:transcription factor HBP-1b(c38)-like isoform X1 n=1 Tax=Papaver somniferum TaxID=3469 RepID=UPI000E6F91AE|nr:transcription factor HBP-1b(c38)-like isoform X1 [Papaver somniferum]
MQSFTVIRGDESSRLNQPRFSDLGELEQSNGFHHNDYINMPHSNPSFSLKSTSSVVAASLQIPGFNSNVNTSEIYSPRNNGVDSRPYFQKGNNNNVQALAPLGNGLFENWGESTGIMPDTSQHTDTSTDTDDHKNQFPGVCEGGGTSVDSMDRLNGKLGDQKSLRRLAQNREAARKSRLRKKAYVQQLESSRIKLNQLEKELQRARQQGIFIASGSLAEQGHLTGGKGNLAFDMEYARWLDEHQRQINDLRTAVKSNVGDNELRLLVDGVMSHYDEIFQLKTTATKSDVFHMLSGMWKTPAERFFMWLGGFRSSELLKILGNHLEPLTDQQLMGICNLQQSSQQAEDALSQGMEALQQSLSETLSAGSLGPGSGNVADYMGQMAIAMGKLGTLENFLDQADLLRQQTLQQMHRILTTRQAARAFLVINDYFSRLRALSSLWLARPRD